MDTDLDGVADLRRTASSDRREPGLEVGSREFEAIFDSSPVGMAVMDDAGRFARVNLALCHFLGRDAAWLVGRTAAAVTLPDDLPVHERLVDRLVASNGLGRVHKRYLLPSGRTVHGLVTAVALSDTGHGSRVLAQIEDVTERLATESELVRLATHDPLTHLPSRRLLLDRLAEAVAERSEGNEVAVAFVDLDGFKLVNDALGHAAGDAVLVETARRLRAVVRPEDTVGRLAGDEFLLVAPGVADLDEAVALVHRVEAALNGPVPLGGDEVFVSASLGLAVSHPGTGVDALLADADAAMYQAKRLGKRRYEVFDQAMRERASERTALGHLLHRATGEQRVVVHYQPVVDLRTRRPVGLEAMMRIRREDGSVMAPHEFLVVAEQTGVLAELDAEVLLQATAATQTLRAAGDDLHVAVNVSASLVTGELVGAVGRALAASGLPADRLTVELTEQTLIDGSDAVGASLAAVRALGVWLSIDDFGTGWASLTYLRRFPVSAIKLDQSFVSGLPESSEDAVIVGALTDLARHLGLSSVTEGVETEEQYATLLSLIGPAGASATPTYAQGHLFGAAVPLEVLPEVLARLRR